MSVTEIHKATAALIWRGYNTLEVVREIRDKFGLGESAEREVELQVVALRAKIAEAVACAQEAADKCVEAGMEWKDVVDYLSRPYLLTSGQAIHFAHKAFEKVKAEQSEK